MIVWEMSLLALLLDKLKCFQKRKKESKQIIFLRLKQTALDVILVSEFWCVGRQILLLLDRARLAVFCHYATANLRKLYN